MKIKSMLQYICLILAMGLLSGCPKPMTLELYNNSGSPITVHSPTGDKTWAPGTTLVLENGSALLAWDEINHNRVPVLRITLNGSETEFRLNYSLPPSWQNGARQTLQIQSDGKLYAVMPTESHPSQVSQQPSGFPLVSLPKK